MQRVIPPRTDDPKEIRRYFRNISNEINTKECANQSASTATTVSDLKDDLNTLLAAMKAAHLMDPD
jgi:hypothetical protein